MQKSTPKASCEAFVPSRIALAWLVALAFIAGIGAPSPALRAERNPTRRRSRHHPGKPARRNLRHADRKADAAAGRHRADPRFDHQPASRRRAGRPQPDEAAPDDEAPDHDGSPDAARPDVDPDAPIPEIVYNLDRLPEPVRRMHDLLVEASKTGDVEKLRPLLDTGEEGTQLSLGGTDGDPIALLRGESGDKEGIEILAILEEVLSAGYVHMDAGTPNEMYVWPYFFAVPLEKLTPGQKVELFKIITAGDYEEMKSYGSYIFYRVGITPEGRWSFFRRRGLSAAAACRSCAYADGPSLSRPSARQRLRKQHRLALARPRRSRPPTSRACPARWCRPASPSPACRHRASSRPSSRPAHWRSSRGASGRRP